MKSHHPKWLNWLIKTHCTPDYIILVFSCLGQLFLWIRPSYPKNLKSWFEIGSNFWSNNDNPHDCLSCIVTSECFASRNISSFDSTFWMSQVIWIYLIKNGKLLFSTTQHIYTPRWRLDDLNAPRSTKLPIKTALVDQWMNSLKNWILTLKVRHTWICLTSTHYQF